MRDTTPRPGTWWVPWPTCHLIAAARRYADASEGLTVDAAAFAIRARALQKCLANWERRERRAVAKKDRAGVDLARRRQEQVRGLLLDIERRQEVDP